MDIKRNFQIGLFLDTRRLKANNKYPVKLRVFTAKPRKQKLYATDFEYTEDDFKSIWLTTKPRKENKEARQDLKAIESMAFDIAAKLPEFNFEEFERQLFGEKAKLVKDINYYYQSAIEQFYRNGQIGTAKTYELSIKSLKNYCNQESISFATVTVQWLKDYEKYMILSENKSQTTVGIYLRNLRTIFNNAIEDKVINSDHYPFGRRKYSIPASKSTKKALSREQLKKLWEEQPLTADQQKAKDFWFFSFYCNGMNLADILNLQFKNLTEETLTFFRAKTAHTNREQTPVLVYLNSFTKQVINKYGVTPANPETYIFPIIDRKASPEVQLKQRLNFIRFINQHFSKFAKTNGISHVSTYYARHSFATAAIRNGASMEAVSEALAHSNLQTTKTYFAGFEDEAKKQMAANLLKF